MNGHDRSIFGAIARSVFVCLSLAYRMAISVRNFQFNMGLRRAQSLGRPVVSIGNLTTGGTGKTPMIVELAQRLLVLGIHPAVLLRGYKPDATVGSDEACLIRESLGSSVAVGCGRRRADVAQELLHASSEIGVFLLDDGFQHRQVDRNLDVVLIDATEPFGFGHLLPRGMLREPIRSVQRADAVIVTRADQASQVQLTQLDEQIERFFGRPPIAHVVYQWDSYTDSTGASHPLEILSQSRVVGVCGIGNPDAFARSLKDHTGEVVEVHCLPDHHRYDHSQLQRLLRGAKGLGVDGVVTTHKDMVKWRPLLKESGTGSPIYYPTLRVVYLDGCEAVDEMLRKMVVAQ